MDTIPASAWEQAVYVCLFIFIVIVLLNWFGKQQDKWQQFIYRRDDDWQSWMDRAEIRTANQMKDVIETLHCLTNKIEDHDGRMMEKLNDHDGKVDERIEKVANGSKKSG